MHDRAQAARVLGPVEQPDQREDSVGHAVEQAAVQQLDAGEQIGRDFALAAAARAPGRVEQIIAVAIIADSAHRALQQQHRVHPLGIEGAGQAQQCRLLAIEPEYVGVDDKKGVAEQRQGLRDPAAGVEQLGFLGDLDVAGGGGRPDAPRSSPPCNGC